MRKNSIKPLDVLKVLNRMFLTNENPINKFIEENKNLLPKEVKKYQVSVSDTNIVYIDFLTIKDKWFSYDILIGNEYLLKTEEEFNFRNFFSILKPLFFNKNISIENFYSSKDEYEINYYNKEKQSASYYLEIPEKMENDKEKNSIRIYCGLFLLSKLEIQQISGTLSYRSFI